MCFADRLESVAAQRIYVDRQTYNFHMLNEWPAIYRKPYIHICSLAC